MVHAFPEGSGSLPPAVYRLLDPAAPVELPPPGSVALDASDNRELDKLVAALGRNKSTWRRALALHDWLLQVREALDASGRAGGFKQPNLVVGVQRREGVPRALAMPYLARPCCPRPAAIPGLHNALPLPHPSRRAGTGPTTGCAPRSSACARSTARPAPRWRCTTGCARPRARAAPASPPPCSPTPPPCAPRSRGP